MDFERDRSDMSRDSTRPVSRPSSDKIPPRNNSLLLMASIIMVPHSLTCNRCQQVSIHSRESISKVTPRRRLQPWRKSSSLTLSLGGPCLSFLLRAGTGSDFNWIEDISSKSNSEVKAATESINYGEGYVGLFVRMLGLDNDPLDREQGIVTLWKYSQGGKDCIDRIMQFSGCINLVVSLLKSNSFSSSEAAAGLLRTVSSVNTYRDIIAESGAIEEILSLLFQPTLTSEVKEQSLCTLWNLSIDEGCRVKLVQVEFVHLLVKCLGDEDMKIKEAAGGILANLALDHSNHSLLTEAGVIPKLAEILKANLEDSKVIRKEAKSTLLELVKEESYRILIIEEGLVRVPVLDSSTFRSFKSPTYSWPTLPDGTNIQKASRPSRYGASELLLGLNVNDKTIALEESKMNAIVGRSRQQFLARIGGIDAHDDRKSQFTILPWVDGVARLVLILGLDDMSAVTRAAYSVAEASINDNMRTAFKEAGAVKYLVRLLCNDIESLQMAAASALERLSLSYEVCQTIESEGALVTLVSILKKSEISNDLIQKSVAILSSIFNNTMVLKRKRTVKQVFNGFDGSLDSKGKSVEDNGMKITDGESLSETERLKVIDSSIISMLVKMLKDRNVDMQIKVASILEYVATNGADATLFAECDIISPLHAIFQQISAGTNDTFDGDFELDIIEAEEIGLTIAAAAQLLTKLLDLDYLINKIDFPYLIQSLRNVLKSNIPLRAKSSVAACLVKSESLLASTNIKLENPIDMEVIIYETIPRLVQQLEEPFSVEAKETAAIELNHVISKGGVECSRAVAANGGIFSLVKLLEEAANDEALEAALVILYNLSMDSENHAAIVSSGVVPILRRIVIAEGPHWSQALSLLRNLPV